MIIHDHFDINEKGHLTIGGLDAVELAQQFGIMSIPTLILFKNGEAVHTMVGSAPKAELVAEIEANL